MCIGVCVCRCVLGYVCRCVDACVPMYVSVGVVACAASQAYATFKASRLLSCGGNIPN